MQHPATFPQSGVPVPADGHMPNTFESVNLGDRALRYICRGEGSPTVVVDQGMSIEHGSFAQPISVGWAKVFGEIQKTTRICMHDRAGLGSSDKAATPRTSQDMVKDLRSLLRRAQIAPPYVLVGHSIGGCNVRLFANQNPEEVLGMVLVDSSHPNQWQRFAEFLPPESPNELPILRTLPHGTDPSFLSDGIDIRASAEQVRATHTLGTKPLVVLTQSPRALRPPGLPPDISDKMRIAWAELQVDLLNLSANGSHVIASHAGHLIQLDEPQLVIDAILKVVHEARAKRPYVH